MRTSCNAENEDSKSSGRVSDVQGFSLVLECWERPSLRRRAQGEPPVRHGYRICFPSLPLLLLHVPAAVPASTLVTIARRVRPLPVLARGRAPDRPLPRLVVWGREETNPPPPVYGVQGMGTPDQEVVEGHREGPCHGPGPGPGPGPDTRGSQSRVMPCDLEVRVMPGAGH